MADFYAPNDNRAPLSHVALDVTSFKTAVPFYTKVLGTFGWSKLLETPTMAAFGPGYFVFVLFEKGEGVADRSGRGGAHIAFEAPSKQAVHDWYEAAVAAGAKGNGEPGPRAIAKNYYAAHVLDHDGYRIEALYHLSEAELAE